MTHRPPRLRATQRLLPVACPLVALSLLATACLSPRPQHGESGAREASPLGPSYVLLPLPGEEESLLGRVLTGPPTPGRSLDEIAQPNPCAEYLEAASKAPLSNTFEDADELAIDARAKATLGVFGFSGDAGQASHLVYKLTTSHRLSRVDTTRYQSCCALKGCGYGYISALIYGEGEYSSAREARGSAEINVAFAGAEGEARLHVLHRRKVRGYLAALVRITDKTQSADQLSPLGIIEASGVHERALPEQVKEIYEREKLVVADLPYGFFEFKTATGNALTENEFARRYKAMSGTTTLESFEYRRNRISMYSCIGSAIVTPIAMIVGIESAHNAPGAPYGQSSPEEAKGMAVFALGLVAGGTTAAITCYIWGTSPGHDGTTTEHDLSAYDARLYVERYNRALLRRVVQDVQGGPRSGAMLSPSNPVRLRPWISPMGLGIGGTF